MRADLVRAAAVAHVCDLAASLPVSVSPALKLVVIAELSFDGVEGAQQQDGEGIAHELGCQFGACHGSGAAHAPRAAQFGLPTLQEVLHCLDALTAVVHNCLQGDLVQLTGALLRAFLQGLQAKRDTFKIWDVEVVTH